MGSPSVLKLRGCRARHRSTQLTSESRPEAVVVAIQQPVQDAGENGDVIFAVINDVGNMLLRKPGAFGEKKRREKKAMIRREMFFIFSEHL